MLCNREEVCQRIASHWTKQAQRRAKQLFVNWPWDSWCFDDNDIVVDKGRASCVLALRTRSPPGADGAAAAVVL